MDHVFGIHVGNSTACLAIFKPDDSKGCVEVIANNAGDRVMPAIVTASEGEYVVGTACKSLMVSRWSTTVIGYKLMLDKDQLLPESSTDTVRKAMIVSRDGELYYELVLDQGVEYKSPSEIASCMYACLYDIAKSASPGVEDISCVLMVPRNFSETARFRIRTAAEGVGWDVLQIINESAATVLGYNLLSDTRTPPPPQTILVYRVGGMTCEASVLDLNHGMMTSLDVEYSQDVGGKLFINTLTNYLADEFYRKYKLNPRDSHRSWTKLTLVAENCLRVLSTIESANCFVESLCDGVDLNFALSRARLESLIFTHLPAFTKPIHTVLTRLGMNASNVSTVLLCGGVMKTPRLKKYICDLFQESDAEILALPSGVSYDEVLACGAARQAGYLVVDKMKDTLLPSEVYIPVLQSAVTVQVEGAESEGTEFPAGQPVPALKQLMISSPGDKVKMTFLQSLNPEVCLKGELEVAKDELEDADYLRLAIDSDFQIIVSTKSDVSNLSSHHLVKMFEFQNIQ